MIPPKQRRRSTPQLSDDLIREILIRTPPYDPTCLARASGICKPWRRLVLDPSFLRRYRALHRTPPILGFLRNIDSSSIARFVPTTSFRPTAPTCHVLDARHGRVLFLSKPDLNLFVWDPFRNEQRTIAMPGMRMYWFHAAVLCAAIGCDHLDCHGGPFLVAYVGSDNFGRTSGRVYSSEADEWSEETQPPVGQSVDISQRPTVLVGNAVYFLSRPINDLKIVEYDVGERLLSTIDPPFLHRSQAGTALMTAEDGTLGFAGMQKTKLYLWSREAGPNGALAWEQRRVIELEMLLPDISNGGILTKPRAIGSHRPDAVGFADGIHVIFVRTGAGVFSVELSSGQMRKVSTIKGRSHKVAVIPYMSFYTPGRLPPP